MLIRIRLVLASPSTHIKRLRAAFERLEGRHDILRSPDLESGEFEAKRSGCRPHLAQLQYGKVIADIAYHRQAAETGDDLAQKFESLARNVCRLDRQASDVAARSRQAGDEFVANRVARDREHYRNDGRRVHRGHNGRGSRRDDDIDLAPGKLGRDLRKALLASLGPAVLDRDTTTVDPTKFAQSLHKLGHPFASGRTRVRAQEPDGRHLRWLLRPRCERPRRRAAEQRDKLAPPHSITSSARSRIAVGSSMPIALAVFRLTTSWNFVACSTGRSVGFAPLRIFATYSAARRYIPEKSAP